ncbi:MAG TPA: hypothetical protein EYP43_02110 [Thermoplasmata archaeon]|nr:hypothetical protein [Thermoplasmata archaeon]
MDQREILWVLSIGVLILITAIGSSMASKSSEAPATSFEDQQSSDENKTWEHSAEMLGVAMGIILICCVVSILIAILLAVWIYRDAESRGKSGVLWVILLIVATLFGSFIGTIIVIVIWLIVRPPKPEFYARHMPRQYGPPPGQYGPPRGPYDDRGRNPPPGYGR